MAAKNKYASINFNHVYEKTTTASSSTNPARIPSPASSSSPSYSASYSAISSPNKSHGRMLVLTRPNPKPVAPPAHPSSSIQSQQHQHQQSKQTQQAPDQPQSQSKSDANEISLRPLGRTGTGSSLSSPVLNSEKNVDIPSSPLLSAKPGKFVPPHLRPGFVPKEEKIGPDAARSRQQGHVGLPGRYGEDSRPKSGGYERMRRGDTFDTGTMRRPTSSGSRPGSSGWYVASRSTF